MTYLLFTDPLAANLYVIGIMFFGIAAYVFYGFFMKKENAQVDQGFAYFLLGTGFYALLYGLVYSILWPAPMGGAYNILFGDPLALFGLVSIFAGYTILKKSSLAFVGVFAFFAGLYAILSGVGGYNLHMTHSPIAMLLLYLAAGIGGILTVPIAVFRNTLSANKWIAILLIIAFLGAAILSFYIGSSAISEHMAGFAHSFG